MAVRTGRLVVLDRRTAPAHIPACSVEHDAPYPGLERAVATEGAALAHRRRERLLHCVTRSVGVAGHARRDASEDVEAAAVQRFELVQARSVASDHTSLMRTMSIFFSRCRPTVSGSLGGRSDRLPDPPADEVDPAAARGSRWRYRRERTPISRGVRVLAGPNRTACPSRFRLDKRFMRGTDAAKRVRCLPRRLPGIFASGGNTPAHVDVFGSSSIRIPRTSPSSSRYTTR